MANATIIARLFVRAAALVSVLAAASCNSSEWSDKMTPLDRADGSASEVDGSTSSDEGGVDSGSPAGQAGSAANPGGGSCVPAVSSDQLRVRDSVMMTKHDAMASAGASGVFTRDLFNLFRTNCGACHAEQSLGGFHVTAEDFATKVDMEAFNRVTSDDPAYFMPPQGGGGKAFSTRTETDPVVELAKLLEAWLAAGRPADVFYPQGLAPVAGGNTVSYRVPVDVGMQMTNLANCIPQKSIVGLEEAKAKDLDALFEQATTLPERLEQTDLYALDANTLARDGVVAFAPTYTLWADNAKKIRMLRVPRGTSIRFDKAKQSFAIPANTRFYKTFLKKVTDLKGNVSYRKLETRLILSRPDDVLPDGSRKPTALFGTYAWNEQETEAVLVRDPLRNGTPFRDRLVTYVIDEQAADDVISEGPRNLEQALEKAGLTRTYAIPGSERCIQCHMGSPNASFILGFTPLQINRRPLRISGVIEPADRDELSQMQRLIDYGIVTGMGSPADVLPLEQTQGDRKPRTEQELTAQGYMVGNCSHCHNPHGFPSVTSPELKDVLNFLPSDTGGIFQFPLERFSPRVFRGDAQKTKIPYITTSLYDFGEKLFTEGEGQRFFANNKSITQEGKDPRLYILAPWRSLIYRNVDTPFSYVDDKAIFPHMPRHTSGYDCRVRQLMGEWMASIPARLKDQSVKVGDEKAELHATAQIEQPYEEVKANDPEYAMYAKLADTKLTSFRGSARYNDCPDPKLDILDPRIRDNPDLLSPLPLSIDGPPLQYNVVIPSRPHWFVTDTTDAPGDWYPRRADWKDVLVDKQSKKAGELELVEQLETIKTTEQAFRDVALTPFPFGIWADKPECRFPSGSTVGDISKDKRPAWMRGDVWNAKPPADDKHVYSISPGEQIFNQICRNCHGPQADSKSRLADTIADLTGGATRVANLRDGIFGPVSSPGKNRTNVFGPFATDQLSVDDRAARYVDWMTLGGTQRLIPPAAVDVILSTYVLGEPRHSHAPPVYKENNGRPSANMLQTAQHICSSLPPIGVRPPWNFDPARGVPVHEGTSMTGETVAAGRIFKNGDSELWEKICLYQNPMPVRVVVASMTTEQLEFRFEYYPSDDTVIPATPVRYHLFRRDKYGIAPVGDSKGVIRNGIDAFNAAPWCIRTPSDDIKQKLESDYWPTHAAAGSKIPYCPAGLLSEENRLSADELDLWSRRGAMSAGLAVFLYLDNLTKGQLQRVPDFDRCEELVAK